MSARLLSLPATVILSRHAGTWLVHGLWVAMMALASCTPLFMPQDKVHLLRLVFSSLGIAFWWLLMGGHLLGTAWQMHRLRLPTVWSTLSRLLLPAFAVTVLLPALLWAALDQASALTSVWSLSMVMLGAMLLTSLPPVVAIGLVLVGPVQKLLVIAGLSFEWSEAFKTSAMAWLPCLAIALIALCWWPLFRRGAPASSWLRPIAIALQTNTGAFTVEQMRQQQAVSWYGGNVHPHLQLPTTGRARAAMGVILGPGLGRPTLRALLLGHAWLLAITGLWLWIYHGKELGGGDRVAFFFPAFIVASVSTHGLLRIWTLFRRPEMGLYDLALLPGLPRAPAVASDVVLLLLTRMGTTTLITTAIMCGYGALLDAAPAYYALQLGIGLACVLVNACIALWCVRRGGLHGMWLSLLMLVEAIAVGVTSFRVMLAGQLSSGVLVALVVVLPVAGVLLGRLRAGIATRPQPWIARRTDAVDNATWLAQALLCSGLCLLIGPLLIWLLRQPAPSSPDDTRSLVLAGLGATGAVLIALGLRRLRRAS